MGRRKNTRAGGAGDAAATESVRTEGQRLLLAVAGSQADLAATLGVARSAIGFWRRGEKVPDSESRAKLKAAYGIAPRAWDRRPSGGEEPPRDPPPAAGERPRLTALDGVLQQIDLLLEMQESMGEDDSVADKVRIVDKLNDAYETMRRLELEQELLEDRIVREHPAFQRATAAMLEALRPHPDAARAAAEALEPLLTRAAEA